ncbi:hypothetical protein A0J61_03808 [Choanephora cucurbitarum]|uniref:Uncharacterized protein n=1 Tax=Choanephora cucurbitarum TaxID=101091 RepID=A0A1C7NGB4_9FUNG|nr:hypothetical protein A0J61_03808 [Choanephora cucurbitarum]
MLTFLQLNCGQSNSLNSLRKHQDLLTYKQPDTVLSSSDKKNAGSFNNTIANHVLDYTRSQRMWWVPALGMKIGGRFPYPEVLEKILMMTPFLEQTQGLKAYNHILCLRFAN